MKKYLILAALVAMIPMLSGCFWNTRIDENEVGLIMADGVQVTEVVGPGRHSNWGWFAEIKQIDITSKTNTWSDPDVATRDKQQIGMEIGITYQRGPSGEDVLKMWQTYRNEALRDDALWTQVSNRIARVIKNITTRYSLDDLLGVGENDVSRASVQSELFNDLSEELSEIGVHLIDVGINNITPSEAYRQLLEDKAAAIAAVEIAAQNTLKLQEELNQEKAQTEIALEEARRERLVAEERAKVIEQSDRAYELQRMEIMARILGDKDKIYFLPQDADITLLFGSEGFVPVK